METTFYQSLYSMTVDPSFRIAILLILGSLPTSEFHKFVFYHIPKTGGTAIESALRRAPSMSPYFFFSSLGMTKASGFCAGAAAPWHIPSRVLEDCKIPSVVYENKTVFCVIRNPEDRLLSEYYWQLSHPYFSQNIKANNISYPAFVKSAVLKTESVIKKLQVHRLGSEVVPLSDVTFHLLPQAFLIKLSGCQHHLRFENLELDWVKFIRKYKLENLPTHLPTRNKSQRKHIEPIPRLLRQLIKEVYLEDYIAT